MKIQSSDLNESIRKIPLPDTLRDRPVSRQGYPVPYFAGMVDGEWDFRVVPSERYRDCIKSKVCWICGKSLGSKLVFVVGPMCVVTRTSSEPPSHYSCGQYAALACPFLAQPRMRRNEVDLPEHHKPPAGVAIMRNPGVTALLITHGYRIFKDGQGGQLIEMGEPRTVEWYARRRRATREEVTESITSGLVELRKQCDMETDNASQREAHAELSRRIHAVEALWLPPVAVAASPQAGDAE